MYSNENFTMLIPSSNCHRADSLAAAFAWCWRQSAPGEAILLSPACASTDQFRDFAHRGEEFQWLVRMLAETRRRGDAERQVDDEEARK